MVRTHKLHYVSPQAAVSVIASGHRVFVQGACAHPQVLVDAMAARSGELHSVEIVHLHTEGRPTYLLPEHRESFHLNAMFVAGNAREAVASGYADYLPVFLSEVPQLFRRNVLPLDVALIHVSPPDRHGYCSLGISVDVVVSAVQTARYVVAQVNPHMPRSHGDGLIHVSRIHAACWTEDPLPEIPPSELTDIERAIGRNVAALVEDGATLQMGIGAIPDAVLGFLTHHRKLGVHTEMFSDGLVDLVDTGAVTGECKRIHPLKIVAGFAMGTKKVYDFIDDNPDVAMLDIAYVNDTAVIRKNPRVTAINSALEVDLCGQVCADTIGPRQYSGVGGQMDFIRGASLSEGGKPIIALPSTTQKGISRIEVALKTGAGVTTTRAHVHFVVTEYGAVDLYGKNLRQRARALIDIAHPNHRARLFEEAGQRFGGL